MSATDAYTQPEDIERRSLSRARKFGAIFTADAETLAWIAQTHLASGDFDLAFACADRRCRLIVPSARDLFLRAQAHRAAGRLVAAQHDLAAALALDPTDPALDRAALLWGPAALQGEAAERIVARSGADAALLRKAVGHLFENGAAIAHRLERSALDVSGWIAWAGDAPLRLELEYEDEPNVFLVDPDPDHALAAAGRCAADIAIEAPGAGRLTLRFLAEGAEARVEPMWPGRPRPRAPAPRSRALREDPTPFVTIVAPVYEDLDATRDCLDALAGARPRFAHRILVVDDASPNAALRALLDERAARGEFELIRNEKNLGFAAAVNKALAQRDRGDALLLNADAVLPPGAIDRLCALSRSGRDIGAITPFSNNGELTSYPLRHAANPMPSAEEIAALDACARKTHGDALVDIPNGVGFCLYITGACLDAVGGLPELYARGYYEDVEFCLSAREQGFRNVAAPGVFVGHAGSKSFAAQKRALVVRNGRLIETRFPGYRLETAAFVALDPLRPFRAALDAALPPEGPVTILASGPGSAAAAAIRRAEALKAQHPETAILIMAMRGRALGVAAIDGAPQSLAFDFSSAASADAFQDWLGRLDIRRIELLDPGALPEAALAALLAGAAAVDLLCGDFGWFSSPAPPRETICQALETEEPCDGCCAGASRADEDLGHRERRLKLGRALERAGRVIPLDRLADGFAQRVFKARAARFEGVAAAPSKRAGSVMRLAVLYPHRKPETDRLLLRLGLKLAASGSEAEIVVLGAALDDAALMATGRIFVTGRASPEAYLDMAEDYRADALFAPDRGGGYGDLEATAAELDAPKAYFDWSFGAFAVEWGDLSLDPRICDEKAAARIVGWMNGERRA